MSGGCVIAPGREEVSRLLVFGIRYLTAIECPHDSIEITMSLILLCATI
jgi:hypothetical protein